MIAHAENKLLNEWSLTIHDPSININEQEETIQQLNKDLKEIKRKRKEAYKSGCGEQLKFYARKENEMHKSIKNHILNIITITLMYI